jgi:putative phosphoesterase
VKIGVISDAHCRHEELRSAAEALVADGVEEIVLAGDSHYEYRFSNEIVEVAREFGMRGVLGNHEGVLLGMHGAGARGAKHVRAANLAHVAKTPWRREVRVGGKKLLVVHANPFADDFAYLRPDDPRFAQADELGVDYVVLGHTHVPMTLRAGRTLIVNPGSLMMSRDQGGHGRLTYAVLDTGSDEVRHVRADPEPVTSAGHATDGPQAGSGAGTPNR